MESLYSIPVKCKASVWRHISLTTVICCWGGALQGLWPRVCCNVPQSFWTWPSRSQGFACPLSQWKVCWVAFNIHCVTNLRKSWCELSYLTSGTEHPGRACNAFLCTLKPKLWGSHWYIACNPIFHDKVLHTQEDKLAGLCKALSIGFMHELHMLEFKLPTDTDRLDFVILSKFWVPAYACSVWTVDLAHLLRKFGLNVKYTTLTFGINPGFFLEAFYEQMKEDDYRVQRLFEVSGRLRSSFHRFIIGSFLYDCWALRDIS